MIRSIILPPIQYYMKNASQTNILETSSIVSDRRLRVDIVGLRQMVSGGGGGQSVLGGDVTTVGRFINQKWCFWTEIVRSTWSISAEE